MGLILPRWGLILPQILPSTPVLYSAVTKPFRGYVRTRNTPSPAPKHPFSWPDFESGQNELLSGQIGPHQGKCLKSGQNFSRSGQRIIHSQPTQIFPLHLPRAPLLQPLSCLQQTTFPLERTLHPFPPPSLAPDASSRLRSQANIITIKPTTAIVNSKGFNAKGSPWGRRKQNITSIYR